MARPVQKKKKPAPGKKRTAAPRPSSRLTILILAVLLVGIGMQIYHMFGQLQSARAEETVYAQRLEDLKETNRQLQEDLDNSGSLDLIEDIARDKLGMVSPGEKVFYYSK